MIVCIDKIYMKLYENRFPWHLDWNLLRSFIVIVEEGSITAAANALNQTQPTISSALKRLEDTLEHELIIRSAHSFQLTVAGQALYDKACPLFDVITEIPASIRQANDRISGHVFICLASHVTSPELNEVLTRFAKVAPEATFTLSVLESYDVVKIIQQNRASIGICLVSENVPNISVTPLFREYFGLYCGPSHPLFGRNDLRIEDLANSDCVAFQTEIDGQPLFSVMELRNAARMKSIPKGVSSNLSEVKRMIKCNFGIGALPVHVAERDVIDGSLWQLPPYQNLPEVDIHMLSNPKRNLNLAERLLIDMLEKRFITVDEDIICYSIGANKSSP
jgi:DNA-binding transcriptional LysR family regulator